MANNDTSDKKIFFTFILFIVFFTFILFKLYRLSIISNEYYRNLSYNNTIKKIIIPPLRGYIFDRDGNKLVENDFNYLIKRDNKINNIKEWNELVKINAKLYDSDINIEKEYIRSYIYPTTFSHILGYTSKISSQELKKYKLPKELLMHPKFRVGRGGIEKIYNTILLGKSGYIRYETNIFGESTRQLSTVEPKIGKNIKLTLSLKLQQFVEKRMNNVSGAIIVMNVKTGEILSMFSNPKYDLNKVNDENVVNYWNVLINDVKKPLLNKAVSGLYPPGSTFKLITAIAGLESGWNPEKKVICKGEKKVDKNRILHCWKEKGHGNLNLVGAIKHSCNIYLNEVGSFATIDKIYETATKFGFGEKFEMDVLDIKKGTIPNREWKKQRFNDVWVKGDTTNISIGQGFLNVTPLELVVMTARIANEGYPIKPYITMDSATQDYNKKLFVNDIRVASKKNLEIVKEGMFKVVNEPGGTTYWSKIWKKDYEMAGKTGTAQVVNKEVMKMLQKSGSDVSRLKNHGLFVAFAPFKEPEYAIVVITEFGESGSGSAAPMAKDILLYAQENKVANNGGGGGESENI
ncbi:MAG: penicillin-binding protein 2, partial [Rickettsiales bacterium]|nr:penicillin-binding protein 2 [Rickettsiales bacterium]